MGYGETTASRLDDQACKKKFLQIKKILVVYVAIIIVTGNQLSGVFSSGL